MTLTPAECVAYLRGLKYSYGDIAQAIGVSRTVVNGIVTKNRNCSWKTAQKLEDAAREIAEKVRKDADELLGKFE